ncbi:ComEC/Rec2 family competence protein [Arthrobacter bambusae]|uniref:ComEC/Rec2 family competence protein n=1 Tax=Arthrobacter bambusae TaxID=1338426 RepID=UPI0027808389|nr:ComEC/Rec2 family competence protein [Arthrobacter bambusae]MDQ0028307.1 competence protein ComEC [Arthrobacter bambusae]MDQ0096899.1 competence protein ComEC [Arthrobacter bambusae]
MSPERLDLRLAPSAVLAWAISISAAYLPSLWTGVACVALLVAACLLLTTRAVVPRNLRSLPATFAVACLFGAVVAAHGAMDAGSRDDGPVAEAAAARDSVVMNLLIVGDPRELGTDSHGSGRWAVPAEVVDIAADGIMISSRTRILVTGGEGWDQVVTGQEVRTAGKLKPAKPGQVEAGVLAAATPPMRPDSRHEPEAQLSQETPSNLPQSPAQLKKQFGTAAEWLRGDAAGLLPGMVTGDTTRMDESLETAMKTTGTTHLTAVSGANCSLILGGLVLLARSFRLARGVAAIVALSGLAAFVMMVGPDASVLRAAVMGAIGLTALSSGRRGRSLGFLCLAVTGLLILDPSLGMSVGFLLSVLATLGIVLLARPMASWAPAWVPRWLASAVAVPLAAQLLCSPVIVAMQPQFSSYSLLTNIAVAPFVVPVTILGTIAVPLVPILPWLAVVPMAVAGASAVMVAAIARFFAGLPGAALPWPEGPPGIATMILWSVVSILMVWLVLHPTWVGSAVVSLHRRLVLLIAAGESAFRGRWTGYAVRGPATVRDAGLRAGGTRPGP